MWVFGVVLCFLAFCQVISCENSLRGNNEEKIVRITAKTSKSPSSASTFSPNAVSRAPTIARTPEPSRPPVTKPTLSPNAISQKPSNVRTPEPTKPPRSSRPNSSRRPTIAPFN